MEAKSNGDDDDQIFEAGEVLCVASVEPGAVRVGGETQRLPSRSSSCSRCSCATSAGSSPAASSSLDVHVKRLRAKLEPDPSEPRYLVTVRGLGYKLDL
jgi:hypothetical protein